MVVLLQACPCSGIIHFSVDVHESACLNICLYPNSKSFTYPKYTIGTNTSITENGTME